MAIAKRKTTASKTIRKTVAGAKRTITKLAKKTGTAVSKVASKLKGTKARARSRG